MTPVAMGGEVRRCWRRAAHAAVALGLAALLPGRAVAAAPDDAPAASPSSWVGSWAAAPQSDTAPEAAEQQTLRLIVHTTAAGGRLRLHLSNAYGDAPLRIGAVHVARREVAANTDPTTDRVVTFGGQGAVEVPPHGSITSDAVPFDVPALTDLAVSLYLPQRSAYATTHGIALQTSYVSRPGADATAAAQFPVAATLDSWPFLAGVDVEAPSPAATVVAFGDSITDGVGSTADTNRRWPDVLAARLLSYAQGQAAIGVLNLGIGGNRLLAPSPDPSGAALGEAGVQRFARDVLGQPGVKAVVIELGTNDLGFPGALAPHDPTVTARALIGGLQRLAIEAHRHGVHVIVMTLPPTAGAKMPKPGYATPQKNAVRQQVNAWIRHSRSIDVVVDADRLLRDPQQPARLATRYDSGDHLHPNDAGHAVLGQAIPLDALRRWASAPTAH